MEFLRFDFGFGIHGLSLGVEVKFFELFAVEGYQVRANQRLGFGNEVNVDRPVFFGFEFFNFVFAVANQTKGDRLNAAGRLGTGKLAPQHRRERKADQIVECTAGHVGGNQIVVNLAGIFNGFGNGGFGNFVKDDAFDFLVFDFLAGGQFFKNVPGYRFSFSIRVGCEDNRVAVLERGDDVVEAFFAAGAELPGHGETVVRVDGAVLAGQIADVAETGQNLIIGAEVFVDGFGFGRGLNDN